MLSRLARDPDAVDVGQGVEQVLARLLEALQTRRAGQRRSNSRGREEGEREGAGGGEVEEECEKRREWMSWSTEAVWAVTVR